MNRHQVLTGAANSGDQCFASGSVEGVNFTVSMTPISRSMSLQTLQWVYFCYDEYEYITFNWYSDVFG